MNVRRWGSLCGVSLVMVLALVLLRAPGTVAAPAGRSLGSGHVAPHLSGNWTPVTSMSTARSGLAAVAAPDGRVYAIGGDANGSVEAYTPSSAMWASVAPLPLGPRGSLAAAAGPDGRIYAIGGDANKMAANTLEAYNTTTQAWAGLTGMPTARELLGAATGANGLIYAIGGYGGSGALDTVEAYNVATNTWQTEAPMPTARYGMAVVAGPDGRIYAIGGYNQGALATVEAYLPATNTWTILAPLLTPATGLAAAVGPDGRIYAIGGGDGNGTDYTTVEAYSPPDNSWTAVAPLQTARYFLAAATGVDGRIYALGGISAGGTMATAEAYTPSTGVWLPGTSLLAARGYVGAAATPDGKIYALGGFDGTNYLSSAEVYSPATNAWAALPSMSTPRSQLGASTGSDGRIYAIGGTAALPGVLSSVEAYSPAANTWSAVPSLNTARSFLGAATGVDGRIYALGGEDNNGNILNTVEAYAPGDAAWVTVAPLQQARELFAAVEGPDGRIYAIGGCPDAACSGMLASVEAYTPSKNSWTSVAPLPAPRAGLAAAVGPDGRIYAIGGFSGTDVADPTVEAYTPATDRWVTVAPLLTARATLAAAAAGDGPIYAVGGYGSSALKVNTVEEYKQPRVTAISPTSGPAAGGTLVTIAGSDLTLAGSATAVTFGTTLAASVTCDSSSLCYAVSPPGSGSVDLRVTFTGATSAAVNADQFAYVPALGRPTVSGVSPASGPAAGGTLVVVSGSGFSTSPGGTSVAFGQSAARLTRVSRVNGGLQIDSRAGNSDTACPSTTVCYAVSPGGSGSVDVSVTTAAGTSATSSADQFSYLPPCGPTTLSASPPSPVAAGTAITLTTSEGGCPSGAQYQFWGLPPGGAWTVMQPYSSAASFVWNTPAAAPPGAYTLAVWVRAAGSTNPYDSYAITPFTLTASSPCSLAFLATTPTSSQVVGQPVDLQGASSGCPQPQYAFWILPPSGIWAEQGGGYSASAGYLWDTRGAAPGSYMLAVWARNTGSSAAYESYATLPFTLTPAPCTSATLTPAPATSQTAGQPVTLTATATGCAAAQYEYWLLPPSGVWTVIGSGYTTNATVTWQTPAVTGTYMLTVWVRAVGSSQPYEAYVSPFSFTLTAGSASGPHAR